MNNKAQSYLLKSLTILCVALSPVICQASFSSITIEYNNPDSKLEIDKSNTTCKGTIGVPSYKDPVHANDQTTSDVKLTNPKQECRIRIQLKENPKHYCSFKIAHGNVTSVDDTLILDCTPHKTNTKVIITHWQDAT